MASTLRINCRLAIVVVFLLFVTSSMAFKFSIATSKDASSIESLPHRSEDSDLTALVRPSPDDHSGTYTQALQLLASMQTSPSCNRLAASTLMDSCQSIDGSKPDSEASLDDIRSIYAAQLAMCEIESADSVLPQSCKVLSPTPSKKFFRSASAKTVRKELLSQCLQALESRPQWWTSYSNNKQSAIIMCKASRLDIEKDELIQLHHKIVETNAGANAALSNAVKQSNEELVQLQRNYALAKQLFQEQLLRDLELSSTKAQSFLEKLVDRVDKAVQSTLSKVDSAAKDVESDVSELSRNIQKANADSVDLQRNVGKVFQQSAEGSAELAASQTQQWEVNRGLATELQTALQNMNEGQANALLGAMHNINNQLQISNDIISSMHERHNALEERILSLDNSFAGFESKAETFHAVQTRQAEIQSRLHDQMQVDMQVTRGLLDNVASSAAGLQATVDDTSAKIAQMALLSGITGRLLNWLYLVVVVIVLCLFNPNIARLVAAVGSLVLLASDSGLPTLLSTVQAEATSALYASGFLEAFMGAVALSACVSFIWICYCYRVSRSIRSRRPDVASGQPLKMGVSDRKHHAWHV